jgi:ATP-binding cassette subfamily C protein CydD
VVLDGIHYTYPGARMPVLAGVTLDAGPGLTAITGPSGVGKSTLLELAAGLRTPTAGTVRAGRAHLVTQRPFLPAGTLREALTLGNDADDQALWDALRLVGLEGFVAGLPLALATRSATTGSGCPQASAPGSPSHAPSSATPRSCSLDEPTAHLDAHACEVVHSAITQLAQRHTVIVVTHRTELVALADHHVHLDPATEKVAR